MTYWLFKSEANTWSWDQQVKAGKGGQEWDGVRNFQARNHMKAMKKGDRGFFYHSGDEKRIVGVVEVIREAHPESKDPNGSWVCVDLAAIEPLKTPVTLEMIKGRPEFADMVLVKNSRLSVQPVTDLEWKAVLKLAG